MYEVTVFFPNGSEEIHKNLDYNEMCSLEASCESADFGYITRDILSELPGY